MKFDQYVRTISARYSSVRVQFFCRELLLGDQDDDDDDNDDDDGGGDYGEVPLMLTPPWGKGDQDDDTKHQLEISPQPFLHRLMDEASLQ